jgi:hypothetical protein
MLTFEELENHLPENALDYSAGIPKLNFNNLTGDNLDLTSSVVEATARFLHSLSQMTAAVNAARAAATPALPPITFISKTITASPAGNPVYKYEVNIEVATALIFDGAIDPAA